MRQNGSNRYKKQSVPANRLCYSIFWPLAQRKIIQKRAKITDMDSIQHMTVDQAALSRMQRSNIATYTDVYTVLRNLYANLLEAKERQFRRREAAPKAG
ncbi:hypothetical protein NCCP2050_01490 [Planococcus sp. NCCP-2050]|nr:hypothetical protein NCCP2050_01490 [Planococcus sp. NCCP-2050]